MTAALLATLLPIHVTARPSRYAAIAVDPTSADRIVVGTQEGRVLRSLDGGATWDETAIVPAAPRSWGEEHADATAQQVGLGIASDASPRLQMMLVERGVTPAAMNIYRLLPRVNARAVEVTDLAFDPLDPRVVYAAAADGVHRSRDGGRTFARVYGAEAGPWTGAPGRAALAVAVDPFDTQSVLAGTDRGLRVSHDGGMGFHPHAPTDGVLVRDIEFHASEPGLVFLGTSSGLLRSLDGGDTVEAVWGHESPAAGDVLCVDVAGDVVLFGTGDALLVSYSRGEPGSFRALPAPRARLWSVCAVSADDPPRLVAGAEDALYESTDGGQRWRPVWLGTYEPEHWFSPTLLAIPPTPVAPREAPRDAEFAGGRLYAVTTTGIYRWEEGPAPRARGAGAPLLPPLAHVQDRAMAHLGLDFGSAGRARDRASWRSFLPDLSAFVRVTERSGDRETDDLLYENLPFRFAEAHFVPRETVFFVTATWRGPDVVFHSEELSHRTLVELRVRDVRAAAEEEVRRRWLAYQLARELHARTAPGDAFLRRMYELRMQEDLSYLDAVTGGVGPLVAAATLPAPPARGGAR